MAIKIEGGNRVVDATVEGSVFPDNEKDIEYPVLIDATRKGKPLRISGSVYGRSVVLRGDVAIGGPVISRGDTRIESAGGWARLFGGITVNGNLNAKGSEPTSKSDIPPAMRRFSILVKGDVNVNQNLYLSEAIVFGSVRATNCKLENCIVLGTVVADEKLTVSMSSIAAYTAQSVVFEGGCTMIYAIGESSTRPVFAPYEGAPGQVAAPEIRFYPSLRNVTGLVNQAAASTVVYPDHSRLDFESDWVAVTASPNAAIDDADSSHVTKWVLSLGGRIGDLRKLQSAVEAMTAMLKCGFEFEHYHPSIRQSQLSGVLRQLTPEEGWILSEVCR